MNSNVFKDFSDLTPHVILDAVEQMTGRPMTGLIYPMPSYINRVYELQTRDGERIIVKFYRNGRWSDHAILDEHTFVIDCAEAEIPVVVPIRFANGSTLANVDGNRFALFPKRAGREFDANVAEDWLRIGRLVARMHGVGAQRPASARIRMHPRFSMTTDIRYLKESGAVTSRAMEEFQTITDRLLETIGIRFDNCETIRIHGDCHRANLLERPGEGLMLIDFDDMVMGPPVQDIWLLLPDHVRSCPREIQWMLEGYMQFRDFDRQSLGMIEPLRAMRMIHYMAWCARQREDSQFRKNFPDWGNDVYWGREIKDLKRQLQVIEIYDRDNG